MTTFTKIDTVCRRNGMITGRKYHSQPREEPTPLIYETPPGASFPVDAMGPLREATLAIEDKVQAPVAIGAQALLAATSLAAQALYDVQTLGGVKPLSLFALTIAKSGERKSTCDKLAMEPIRAFEKELSDAFQQERARHHEALQIWEASHSKLIREAGKADQVKSLDTRENLEALGPKPEAPLIPYLTASDPTFEGLTKNLPISRPALGIFSDEAGQFLGGHAMNSENRIKTVSGLSKLWDGDPINRTRAGDAVVTSYGRRLCAHLMVQPVIADTLLDDPSLRDQGFLARFLICQPPSTIGTRLREVHSPASDAALDAYSPRLVHLLRVDLPLAENSRNELQPPVLALTPEAERLLRNYYNCIERQQAPGANLAENTAFASKSAEHAARIAAVLAVYSGEQDINPDCMANGIKLAKWYLQEAVRLKNGASISADVRKAEKLRIWLGERWAEDFIGVTQIVQAGAANVKTAQEARGLVSHRVTNGWLIPVEGGAMVKGKHRKEAWHVVRVAI